MNVPQMETWLGEAEIKNLTDVIRSNWITEGRYTSEFGERLNELFGCRYGVFTPTGTFALVLGLLALEIGLGDEVIVPDTTFIASATSVILVGATPVFVDVNKENFQIDTHACEAVITEKTKAIMPVHLYGMAANMKQILELAEKHNLRIIEDACQAVGVSYFGKHVGTLGDIGAFSFFADKTITTGEGGYVVCKDEEIYKRLRLLRNQGRIEKGSFIHPSIGFNFHITDLQSAVGLAQLDKLPKVIKRKLEIYERYRLRLSELSEIQFLQIEDGSSFVPFRVVLICEELEQLILHLEHDDIQTRRFFYPLHKQPCFDRGNDEQFSNAIYGYEHGICLPVFPTLRYEQVDYVCEKILEFYK